MKVHRLNWLATILLAGCAYTMDNAQVSAASIEAIDAGHERIVDPGTKGPYEVGYTTFVAVDGSRRSDSPYGGSPVPVSIWYPVDSRTITPSTPEAVYLLEPLNAAGPSLTSSDWESVGMDRAYARPEPSRDKPFPLLVFSPGWGVPYYNHVSLATRLASHGFVVAVLTLAYGEGEIAQAVDPLTLTVRNRIADMSFALDEILMRNGGHAGILSHLVNPHGVAAAGHSIGGYAAWTQGSGDDEVCDSFRHVDPTPPPDGTCGPVSPDRRFKAIISLDGSNDGLKFAELGRIRVPAMEIGEEWEAVGEYALGAHAAIRSHPSFRVDVSNSNHFSFTDLCQAVSLVEGTGAWPPWLIDLVRDVLCPGVIEPNEGHRLIAKYMIAFLKTHLADESGYAHILKERWALDHETDIEFFKNEPRQDRESIYFNYRPNQAGDEVLQGLKDMPRP